MEKKKMKCCICGKSFYGNGNNAYPLMRNRENKCCNECNNDYIIPLRMIEILAKKERNKTDASERAAKADGIPLPIGNDPYGGGLYH